MVDKRKFKIGKPILEVKNISLSFGGVKAITNISFNVFKQHLRQIMADNHGRLSGLMELAKVQCSIVLMEFISLRKEK